MHWMQASKVLHGWLEEWPCLNDSLRLSARPVLRWMRDGGRRSGGVEMGMVEEVGELRWGWWKKWGEG